MKYSIKQMANLLGTTTHKLRHYQKVGIIKPVTDETTGYRYYSVLDTRRFNLACYYGNLGYSLNEVGELLTNVTPSEFSNRLHIKQEELKKEIEFKQMCLSKIDRMHKELGNIDKYLNKVIEIEYDEFIRLEFSHKEIITKNKNVLEKRSKLLEFCPLVQWVSRIPKSTLEKSSGNLDYFYGLNLMSKDAKTLGLNIDDYELVPKSKYLYTIIVKKTREPFGWDTLKVIQDFIKENNIENYGDAYSTCIYSTSCGEDYLNFHNIMLKI